MSTPAQRVVEPPKITVVTVVFNDVKNIAATIKSVIDLTYDKFEYVIIDGGSQDGTVDIVKKFQDQLAWISEPDQGIYDAMNKGVGMAHGTWVLFMNCGDRFVNSTVLADMMSHGVTEDDDFVYGDHVVNYGNFEKKRPAGKLSNLWKRMQFAHISLLAKTSILRSMPFDPQRKINGDFELIYQSYVKGFRFKYVPVSVACVSSGGVSDVNRIESVLAHNKCIKKYGASKIQMAYCNYLLLVELFKSITKKLLPSSIVDRIRKLSWR